MFNPARSAKYTPLSAEAFRASIAPQPRFFDKSNLLGQAADLLLFPLVKGGYDDTYRPYIKLLAAGKIIDTTLREDEFHLGVKYYCFENIR